MGNRSAITLALTGASGAPYALRLLQCLTLHYEKIYLLLSAPARVVLATECDIALPDNTREQLNRLSERLQLPSEKIELLARDNWMSAVASGSSAPKQMVVCPCSTGTLSAIAQGASDNLIERAADVVLKEKGQLILVPRETPYSAIHLENMLNLARLGVTILPASPGFYQQPKTVDDLVDFIVARILDHLGIEQTLMPRWGYGNGEN
ncbi:flavin prenyltransferase UbiX [Permianibacter aggregans]|uniref:Flavin prenyltransferase UbiX n=1 Tax=Permianibacter aggregans TaxID=1510150 RepID=A0A4R6UXN1_9GAMM|nr:flavin prenyltransferase UbiX [Permianibacter aggregans]QGX40818.1 UbiX family flavin prenyltransferase [Permianibacter aggregans]TDQ48364.1 4-hydroxy-3-polyprenylbenzoate decarboxylase [Permianibacter aggregans]